MLKNNKEMTKKLIIKRRGLRMFHLKTLTLNAFIFVSSAAFSGAMGPVCTPGNVTVGCEKVGWEYGISALYLHAAYSGALGYAGDNLILLFSPGGGGGGGGGGLGGEFTLGNFYPNNTNKGANWGYKLEAAYDFNLQNDFNINSYHFETNDAYTGTDILITPGGPGDAGYDPATGYAWGADLYETRHFKTQWDAVNFELGQKVVFSTHKKMRFHGGVQWAILGAKVQVDPTQAVVIMNDPPFWIPGTTFAMGTDYRYSSQFNGLGPRTGLDMAYLFANNFNVYAKGAVALLVGKTKSYRTAVDFSYSRGFWIFDVPAAAESLWTVTPEIELKLGAGYTHAIAKGEITLDGGYMWVDYLKVHRAIGNGFIYSADFAVSGPYLGLKYVGNL
jgi:hypothetical protein